MHTRVTYIEDNMVRPSLFSVETEFMFDYRLELSPTVLVNKHNLVESQDDFTNQFRKSFIIPQVTKEMYM